MPGLYSHYLAASAVYDKLPAGPMKELIDKYRGVYDIAAQGPDVFGYYKPTSGKRSEIVRFRDMLHERQIDQSLRNMIHYTSTTEGKDKDILTVFLMGYITHYALDATLNPYMFYRSGFVSQGRGDQKKLDGYYRRLRGELDVLILKKLTGKTPAEFAIQPKVEVDYSELDEFCRMFPVLLKQIYGKDTSREFIIRSYQGMYEFAAVAAKGGFKKALYSLFELLHKEKGVVTQLFFPKKIEDLDQLNENHRQWMLPWDARVTKQSSVMELFDEAVTIAIPMVEAIYRAYNEELSDFGVVQITGGWSFSTGVQWNAPMLWKNYSLIYENNMTQDD